MNQPATSTALTVTTPAWTAGIYGQLEAAKPVAELLAKSELVPKGFQGKPMDILIAGAMGARLGLDLFSSLAGIAVINGRATLWGDALLAVCQQHPDFGDYIQDVTGEGDAMIAAVTVTRKGRTPHTETFSMADAKRAGLSGKQGPWTQYPKRMLALRARAFALRAVFADALAGFHAREEMDDEVIDVTSTTTVHSEPKNAKKRDAEAIDKAINPGGVVSPAVQVEIDKAKQDAFDVEPVKSVEQHLAETQAAEPPKPRNTSVEACMGEFGKLWRMNPAGKSRGQKILYDWKIAKVSDLSAAGAGDRESFLIEVEKGIATCTPKDAP